MKKWLVILVFLLLLSGCNRNVATSTLPSIVISNTVESTSTIPVVETTIPETVPPEPSIPWIEAVGTPWDAEGTLLELPLTIPNGLIYASTEVFDGDLLLWSQDLHLLNSARTQLCLLDLDTGEAIAQADIPIGVTMIPQALADKLYLIDCGSGVIIELDKQLHVLQQWQTGVVDAQIFMGHGGIAYVQSWVDGCFVLDLSTGQRSDIFENGGTISYMYELDGYLRIEYYHPDTGEVCFAGIDLITLQRYDSPIRGGSGCMYMDGNWLAYSYDDSSVYTVIPADGEPLRVDAGYDNIQLMGNGRLLRINETNSRLSLHDLTGKNLAECVVSERDYGYSSFVLIPSETFGGYFLVVSNYDMDTRLLYWDTDCGLSGDDILFEPIPEPSEMEAQIQSRVEEIEQKFDLSIFVGLETKVNYYDFEVVQTTDWDAVEKALDTLEDALEDYPPDFFRQLRYGSIHRTEIHLVGALTAINSEYTDSYVAFVQENHDHHLMVVDIFLTDVGNYYHEFSHIIDSVLEWDAAQRPEAMFSDETWCSLNPRWFPGYTYTYSWEQHVQDYTCFIDSYSTINPTEDRARILEYAMIEYGEYYFTPGTVLFTKLEYYCKCIRDAFDTTLWPETVLWEQYLTE